MITKQKKQRTSIVLKIYHIDENNHRKIIGGCSWLYGLELREKGAKFIENGVAYSVSKLLQNVKALRQFSLTKNKNEVTNG